ncbi:MAG TPA: transcriptional regulator GcvA [Alphaproteobacteria bacterium]|nr:transcriptional regulator GcvA [Alphaproteobacteria bacterium]
MARHLPPLNALRAFEASARLLSFTKAAEELGITPSAISHQIRGLEAYLGVRLFRRTTRALMLTEEGQGYLPALRDAFDGIHAATTRLSARQAIGPLTVSLLSSFAVRWLIPRLPRFQAAHPEIEIRLSTTVRVVDFRREDVDCAIRYGRGHWPGLSADLLRAEDLFPACSPKLTEGPQALKEPRDLARFPRFQVMARPDDWRIWLNAAGITGIDPECGPQFETSDMALRAAAEGLGVAIGGSALVEDDLRKGRLIAPFGFRLASDSGYYFVTPEDRCDQPKIAAFRDWLLREVGPGAAADEARATQSTGRDYGPG